ncbi:MAG: hypothetical protein L3J91_02165, partial [Thermoplasmata archaeon]|nr:hypothetical protein [Thermoplasmata archaeon]
SLALVERVRYAFLADHLGVSAPNGISRAEAIARWGEDATVLESASRRAFNGRLRHLGWVPQCPSYRLGVGPVLASVVSG